MSYSEFFVEDMKDDSKTRFIKIKDGAPQFLRDFVRSVHVDIFDGLWPNDWVYKIISQAFEELEENGNDLERVSIEPDCYYYELDKWFSSSLTFSGFCDEAVAEGLASGKEIYKTIAAGQYLAMIRIYGMVYDFLNEHSFETEEMACD